MDTFFAFFDALPGWLNAITALTPTKTDDKYVSMALKVLNTIAGNIGKNKNADDTE